MDVNTHAETATGRLYLLMNHMQLQRPSPQMLFQHAFAGFYDVQVSDLVNLFPLVASAVLLPGAAEEELRAVRLPVPAEEVAVALTKCREALAYVSQLQNVSMSTINNIVTEGTVVALRFASEALWQYRGEPGTTAEALQTIRDAVDELIEAVTNDPDLDLEARRLLLKHATALHEAVAHYRAFGFESLREWEERFVGAMALAPAARTATEGRPGVMKRIVAVFAAVNTVATAVHAAIALGGDTSTFAQLVASGLEQPPAVEKH